LQTADDWLGRQRWIQKWLLELWGPFPKRTPLNARVVDVLQRDGYRIEKLIYESQPKFYVTGALFIPDGLIERAPGILFCSGHSPLAFRRNTYQRLILNFVKKGFVVLAFDPVSQGERFQYYDLAGTRQSRAGPPSREHTFGGSQGYLVGLPLARLMIWDGMRALDYFVSREEVDPERIGITGQSGGGTQSAFIAALDQRVRASAPQLYLTSHKRLLQSMGPQDAEQVLAGSLPAGFDLGDFLTVRAPRPTLIVATTQDIFNIQGVYDIYREAHRAYTALGAPEALQLTVDDAFHESTKKNCEALYRFFQESLSHSCHTHDEEVEILEPEELFVTSTGQLATSMDDAKTVHDLVREEALPHLDRLERKRQQADSTYLQQVTRKARALTGYRPPENVTDSVWTERYQRDGYAIKKHYIETPGYPLPFLLFVPHQPGPHPAVIYLHHEGKAFDAEKDYRFARDASEDHRIVQLVRRGFCVLALDVVGTGELGPGDFEGHGYEFRLGRGSYAIWYFALYNGRSLIALKAADIVRAASFLKNRGDVDPERIAAIAFRSLGPVLLHAAVFDETISRVALIESLLSYESLVTNRFYDPYYIHQTVAGSVPAYDLQDLMASLAPRPLLVLDPRDDRRDWASRDAVEGMYAFVRGTYKRKQHAGAVRILHHHPERSVLKTIRDWLAASSHEARSERSR
jgi:cephalosporin-C deacetylase-like acetyl esterase